jgi:hypothetical protein
MRLGLDTKATLGVRRVGLGKTARPAVEAIVAQSALADVLHGNPGKSSGTFSRSGAAASAAWESSAPSAAPRPC